MEIQVRTVSGSVVDFPVGEAISVTPVVSASPDYSAGDAVGGKQSLTSAARWSGGVATLDSLSLLDRSNQKKALTILFFDSDPAVATITDNAAFVFSTDASKCIGKLNILTTDYETIDSLAIATLRNIGLQLMASGSANLFAVVIAGETINLAGVSDLVFRYGFR